MKKVKDFARSLGLARPGKGLCGDATENRSTSHQDDDDDDDSDYDSDYDDVGFQCVRYNGIFCLILAPFLCLSTPSLSTSASL